MFRTICVYKGEKISVKDNWLVVKSETGENRIPIGDIYSIIIDNRETVITVPAITELTSQGAHILICNEKHLPVSVILPQNIHYHPLSVIRRQIDMDEEFKNKLWDRIIIAKIENQAKVLEFCAKGKERANRLRELSAEVTEGDSGNREGISARIFFHEMYGFEFIRMNDDAINSALNYGYTVIRSAFAKTLAAYGYNCVLGLHHINESNAFNLADDMMEPLRPIVDMWVDDHCDELVDHLTKQHKNELAALVNSIVVWDKKKMRLRNAIDKYISSLTTAINHRSDKMLKIPEIIRADLYNELDDD